jgi:hypothetical protein
VETFFRWEPVTGIAAPCFDVRFVDRGLVELILTFSRVHGGHPDDLWLQFTPNVLAFTSHDEFVHPWNRYEHGPVPRLEGRWTQYLFPLLVVNDSEWAREIVDGQIHQRSWYTHYRIVSLDHTVDILTSGTPIARWISAPSV